VLGQKQNPRREWRREAPPFSSWVLYPCTLGDSYMTAIVKQVLKPKYALQRKVLQRIFWF